MSAAMLPSPAPRLPDTGRFGRALLVGAVLEILLIGVLVYGIPQHPIMVKPQPKVIAIHMVKPAPKPIAKPKPKPTPKPKPVVHPKPIPLPRPIPKPAPKVLAAKIPVPTAPVIPAPLRPSPPPPPSPSPAVRQAALDEYAAMVRARVQTNLHIPEELRLMHLSGVTVVAFELTPGGQLLWARVSTSSGMHAVDRAAVRTVKTTSYPPFTKKMPHHDTVFTVDVHIRT
ncbi:TonB family protein [Acidithiobacillus ferrianus]|uniref:TonB family protein n=1 Tax=Acidithiobacillus ferrianus TaxID=2678518 RepID=UPI0034E61BE3